MRILVWNVNGLGPTLRNIVLEHGDLRSFFQHHQADVVCIQETKVQEGKVDQDVAHIEGFESFWACSQDKKGYSGVCTWTSKEHSPVSAAIDCLGEGAEDFDKEGRVVVTDLEAFVLVNVYVPNAGDPPERVRLQTKLEFLRKLKEKLEIFRQEGRQVLVVGDFNIAVSKDDIHACFWQEEIYTEEEMAAFRELLVEHVDVWRSLHPDETNTFTVFNERKSYRDSNKGLRIDYILASTALMEKVVSCEVIATPKKWSDHTALLVELKDIAPIPTHRPCALSSALRFKRQKTLLSMFGGGGGRKRKAASAAAADQDNETEKDIKTKQRG